MPSLFSKIVTGEITAHLVAENDDYVAFMDIMPLTQGHVLVIPKKEIDYIFDIDDELYLGLMIFTKEVAKKIKKVIDCKKVGVAVIGLEVPHAHVHLIPMNNVSDMNFANPKLKPSQEELSAIAEKIRNA